MPNKKVGKRILEEIRNRSSDSNKSDDSDSVFRRDNDKSNQHSVEKKNRSFTISVRQRRQERSIGRDESSRSRSHSNRGRRKRIERNSVSRSRSNEMYKSNRNRHRISKLKRREDDHHSNLKNKIHSKENRRSSSSNRDRSIDKNPRKSHRKKSESRERKTKLKKYKRGRSPSSSESLDRRKTNINHHRRRYRSPSISEELIPTLKTSTPSSSRITNTKDEIIENSPEKNYLLNSIKMSNSVADSSYNIMKEVNSNVPQRTMEQIVKIPVQSSAGTIVKDCFSVGTRPDVTAVREMPYICGACEERPVVATTAVEVGQNVLTGDSKRETGRPSTTTTTTTTTAIPCNDGKRRYMLATQLSDHLKLKHNIHIHPSLLKPNKAFPPLTSAVLSVQSL